MPAHTAARTGPTHRSAAADTPTINDRPIFWGLIVLLFWAPLPIGSNRTWAMSLLLFGTQLLLLATLYAWRHAGHAARARLHKFRWPIGLLAAYAALLAVQLIPLPAPLLGLLSPEALRVQQGVGATRQLSLDPSATTVYATLGFAYLSIFIVTLLTVRDTKRLDTLAYAIVLSGLLQAILGILLFSAGATYRIFFSSVFHSRVIGTFVYHNHFAGYMEICLSVGIGLMLARLGSERGPRGNWRYHLSRVFAFILSPKMRLRMMLIVLVIALVLTRSRMGNTAFFAAMLIVGVISIILSRKRAPATLGLIASLIIIDILVIGTWVGLEKVVTRVQETTLQTSGQREESVEQRQDAASHALNLINDFPLFGTGGGSFYESYVRYKNPGATIWFDHAHNDYIELAADNGLIGLGLLGAFVLLSIGCGVVILVKRHSSLPRGMAFGGLMAMVALVIHSFVDFNLQLPANALTLMVVIAMVWSAQAAQRQKTIAA